MEPYSKTENCSLYLGDMLDILDTMDENSIDSIITDPPYELNFMGKDWDNAGVSFDKETWGKCLRVLKPGGYLLAFGGSRTYHRIACAIEDAGFEIRDTIIWLYGSGFPKSMNIGKKTGLNEWQGWGTALKPSFEPIIMARKPFKGSLVDNVLKYGVGGLNIDDCRVPFNGDKWNTQKSGKSSRAYQSEATTTAGGVCEANDNGRFPANTILDTQEGEEWRRYFYHAKASRKDRDEGLDDFEKDITDDGRNKPIDNPYLRGKTLRHNTHPTVKPTTLMQYLIRLVSPKGATILDPFMGSGSTGKAVMYENKERDADYKFIGIEMTEEYLPIAQVRIDYAKNS